MTTEELKKRFTYHAPKGDQAARYGFTPQLIDNLVRTKRQEIRYMAELAPEEVLDLYLDTV